jgi:hypothetical protein
MTKAELLKELEKYPDDIDIEVQYSYLNCNCPSDSHYCYCGYSDERRSFQVIHEEYSTDRDWITKKMKKLKKPILLFRT